MSSLNPNFFIPGAQKCGTTSYYYLLKQHPQCFMPEDKEPQILAHPQYSRTDYLALFEPLLDRRVFRAIGEASTSYLVVDGVAQRIRKEFGPELRFVIMLRDPARRVLSAYQHMFKRGHEHRDWNDLFGGSVPASEVERGEADECERAAARGRIVSASYRRLYGANWSWNFRYFRNSCYTDRVAPFFELFGRERCLVVFAEDIATEPAREYRRVCTFLGLDPGFTPYGLDQRVNETVVNRPLYPLRSETVKSLRQRIAPEVARFEEFLAAPVPAQWKEL